jgi:N-acetylated-alpha-linked acidic dipeptidase
LRRPFEPGGLFVGRPGADIGIMRPLRIVALATVCALLGAAAPHTTLFGFTPQTSDRERELEGRFLDLPSASGALENAAQLGAFPHAAGSWGDKQLAEMMRDRFAEYGLDASIETFTARVDSPQRLILELSPTGERRYPARTALKKPVGPKPLGLDLYEVPLVGDPDSAAGDVGLPFNSGSADGDVFAPLVYAGHGLDIDYDLLAKHGVSVKGAVVLIRYGAEFRGLLAVRAQGRGAAGVIFYSDPADDGAAIGPPDPYGPWRPLTSVQRGSVGAGVDIPTLPVSAANAQTLLAALHGPTGPAPWGGGLPVEYPFARGPAAVHLVVRLERKTTTLWNTIGTIHGRLNPQTVILGAHRDAWVYGVGDNGAGVVTMLEVARGLGYLVQNGWRPLRSITIVGWDGEELGNFGSIAFVEKHAIALKNGGIAYLNADENVTGQDFGASAVAALSGAIAEAARDVPDPARDQTSVLDRWRLQYHSNQPPVFSPGGGSDRESFLFGLGVPVADIAFAGPFGVARSRDDTVQYATAFSDPLFVFHRTTAQLYGVLALRLADADVVPYRFAPYAAVLRAALNVLEARPRSDRFGVDFGPLDAAVQTLATGAFRYDAATARAAITVPARSLEAARQLDLLTYATDGDRSTVIPELTRAVLSDDPASFNVASARLTAAILAATALLTP